MNAPRPFAFPSTARLRKRIEFERVRREGTDSTGRAMRLAVFKTSQDEAARVGIVTSRRVGSAVVRSRLRRKLREICRFHRQNMQDGLWLVVVVRAAAARASYEELQSEWLRLARRLDLFKEAK
ncbi:MAG: ribonuclease P protein component [Chthoniobacterales bacterium]